ncbi:MAG TPA: phosphatase PAP2 family protein [Micropepsaceae bacterium]|nr:phosphatase PAP2 family protein [Micropepsaceae bacterium]
MRSKTQTAWLRSEGVLVPLLAMAILLFTFGSIAEEVVEGEPLAFDRPILLAMRMPGNPAIPVGPAWLPDAARDITSLGSVMVLGLILLSAVGYLLLNRRRAAAWWVIGAVAGGLLLNNLLKFAVGRSRPEIIEPAVKVFSSSFPSGHASLSAIAYLTLGVLLARTQTSLPIRIYIISLAVLVTILVGISRIYLGVHYPSDVLAGWCIGAAWAIACWAAAGWYQRRGGFEPPIPR